MSTDYAIWSRSYMCTLPRKQTQWYVCLRVRTRSLSLSLQPHSQYGDGIPTIAPGRPYNLLGNLSGGNASLPERCSRGNSVEKFAVYVMLGILANDVHKTYSTYCNCYYAYDYQRTLNRLCANVANLCSHSSAVVMASSSSSSSAPPCCTDTNKTHRQNRCPVVS